MKSKHGGLAPASRPARSVLLVRVAGAAVAGTLVTVAASNVPSGQVAVTATADPAAPAAQTPSASPEVPFALPESVRAASPRRVREASSVASRSMGRIGSTADAVATTHTGEIPAAALAAYQRAATVIEEAMPSCNLSWELVAALGRVESDHGRFGGSALNRRGVATPSIIGIALTGAGATARISDSDAGTLDGDRRFDRAVGPMQFLPSTWSVVGVDADGDGERNPQDIDDAALAAGVYLCGDGDDLGTDRGRRDAVYSYNHSDEYVDTVLALMRAYAKGSPMSWTAPGGPTTVQVGGAPGTTPIGTGGAALLAHPVLTHAVGQAAEPVALQLASEAGVTHHTHTQAGSGNGGGPSSTGGGGSTPTDEPTDEPTNADPVTEEPVTPDPVTDEPTDEPPADNADSGGST